MLSCVRGGGWLAPSLSSLLSAARDSLGSRGTLLRRSSRATLRQVILQLSGVSANNRPARDGSGEQPCYVCPAARVKMSRFGFHNAGLLGISAGSRESQILLRQVRGRTPTLPPAYRLFHPHTGCRQSKSHHLHYQLRSTAGGR